ncbi:putative serine-type endopeptidase with a peptidoglycan binding-like domain [Methylorubrum extorquens DM4]|uniref:Serine-type endopeptidase with a peptidoglycan binding-like domain n=2 Tax=Methylorubrum extorquens TaxID=408 RepID=C7CH69_METED|nr:putative serine-type endopeptidase with a peptidoglycan binding-like domain [Methylorubrum extorquens DM4]
MRSAALILLASLHSLPAVAQTRTPEFTYAESVFNESLDFRSRVMVQVLLIASGHQNSVPTEQFGLRTFAALKRFQAENNLRPDGAANRVSTDRLYEVGRTNLDTWGFRLTSHPRRSRAIWIPQGMGLRSVANKNGLSFHDPLGRLRVAYNYLPGVAVEAAYSDLLEKMRRDRFVVHYSVIKDGWFVISATTPNGEDEYVRYHQDGDGILGFTLFWNNERGNVSGERIAILMSASLGSVMNGRPMIEPPGSSQSNPQVAAAPLHVPVPVQPAAREAPSAAAPLPPPAAVSPPAPVPPVTPKAEEKGISTGTGFFVDAKGNLITNAHVVKDCKVVSVKLTDGKPAHKARVVATDTSNDLALLAVEDAVGTKFAALRMGTRLGEGIAVFGYPHADILASSGNFTLGNVTALSGLGDDSRYYQISAPVQQGNSGGPLLDNYGNAVGVVAAKLNVLKMAMASGDFAQNINFAIKTTMLATFLEANQISMQPGVTTGAKLDPADLADAAKGMSGFVVCQ